MEPSSPVSARPYQAPVPYGPRPGALREGHGVEGRASPTSPPVQDPASQANAEPVSRAIETYLRENNIGIKYRVSEETGDLVVKVFNKEDGKLIREIPMEHLVRSAAKCDQGMPGLIHVVA